MLLHRSLNMRTSHAIYKVLRRYIQVVDAAHPTKHDPTIDHDFRSGVDFGIGCSSLILSLLPSTAVKIVELFGFSGNREEALDILMKTGGWTKGGNEPFLKEGPGNEGLRRPVSLIMSPRLSAASKLSSCRSATWCFLPITSLYRASFPRKMSIST